MRTFTARFRIKFHGRAYKYGRHEGSGGHEALYRPFRYLYGPALSSRTNCAIISFEDTLTINFASCIIEADVERYFFRKLVEDGIHVKIESNRTFDEEI